MHRWAEACQAAWAAWAWTCNRRRSKCMGGALRKKRASKEKPAAMRVRIADKALVIDQGFVVCRRCHAEETDAPSGLLRLLIVEAKFRTVSMRGAIVGWRNRQALAKDLRESIAAAHTAATRDAVDWQVGFHEQQAARIEPRTQQIFRWREPDLCLEPA